MPAFGVIFHPKFPPETLAAYARRAEAAGFDELWLWDGCFLPGALTSAAIALSATQSLIESIQRLTDAGPDSIVFQLLDGDEDCLEEYAEFDAEVK